MVGVHELFSRPPGGQSAGQIIWWWEARRLHYNLIVFASILLGWAIPMRQIFQQDSPWKVTAYLIAVSAAGFMLPANLWYTLGWVVDLALKRWIGIQSAGFGPWALGAGVVFSVAFVLGVILIVSAMAGYRA
jgi:hypothetical protein